MPLGLTRRNAGKLLQTVGGKRHATQADHVELLPTPPSTDGKSTTRSIDDEDFSREPDDSDDEMQEFSLPSTTLNEDAIKINAPSFIVPRQLDGAKDELSNTTSFKTPTSLVSESVEKQNTDIFDTLSSETDGVVFEDFRSTKRQKTNGVANLFTVPRKQIGYGRRKTYGGQAGSTNTSKAAKIPKTQNKTPSKPEFKKAKGADMFEFGKTEPLAQFRAPRCSVDTDKENDDRPLSRSSSRSSLSDPPSEDEAAILQQNLPKPRDYKPECAICGELVNVLLKEEFENEYTDGKTMRSYKWQQRFCRWHKEQDAKRARDEKGYPDIDWHRLEMRMRRCHRHLKNVMDGLKPSFHRDQLNEKVKERSKTTMQVLNDGAKRGASVGYYGPRGERVMTEHIINHLSDELRGQSTKDRLVAAAGVSGGVSGFVQAVLVPELAEQLVIEDLKVSSERAREIITESVELGELLYPDVDDKVAEAVEL